MSALRNALRVTLGLLLVGANARAQEPRCRRAGFRATGQRTPGGTRGSSAESRSRSGRWGTRAGWRRVTGRRRGGRLYRARTACPHGRARSCDAKASLDQAHGSSGELRGARVRDRAPRAERGLQRRQSRHRGDRNEPRRSARDRRRARIPRRHDVRVASRSGFRGRSADGVPRGRRARRQRALFQAAARVHLSRRQREHHRAGGGSRGQGVLLSHRVGAARVSRRLRQVPNAVDLARHGARTRLLASVRVVARDRQDRVRGPWIQLRRFRADARRGLNEGASTISSPRCRFVSSRGLPKEARRPAVVDLAGVGAVWY